MVWEDESRLSQEHFDRRLSWLLAFTCVCFAVVVFYLFYLQVIRGGYFYRESEQNSTQFYIDRAPRGFIYDSKNNVLCWNKPVPRVLFYPFMRGTNTYRDDLERIEKLLPGSASKMLNAYKLRNTVCLAEGISRETMFKLLEQKNKLNGISVVMESNRYYPYGELACHLLGYVGEIERSELSTMGESGYIQGDIIGKTGIERKYDRFLRGKDGGWLMESDADGRNLNILRKVEPRPGDDLHLTIDMNLQKVAEAGLKETGHPGAVVGIDPRNGAVRILASCPGFDPNIFVRGQEDTKKERNKYLRDRKLPLYNRTTQGQYPPGSVFKIVTSLAALSENKIDINGEINCPGYFKLGKRTFKCWKAEGHGRVNFLSAFRNSCDVYFYNLGLQTGLDLMLDYARKFHLGRPTGIDLSSEKAGFLPDRLKGKKAVLYKGDVVNLSIGQGYIDVTAMQLAVMTAAVANRGVIWQPYLVDKIINREKGQIMSKTKPARLDKVEATEFAWNTLKEGMLQVVNSGTGYGSFIPGLEIAGKTGTAQNPHGDDHAWFVAYAPADKPELALVVFVENGGHGGSVSAPVARNIFLQAFRNRLPAEGH
jgi:penicillin-binding protein 2